MSSSARAGVPDTASADRIGIATLDSLARAARQVALYGPEHPTAAQALSRACLDLEAAADGGVLEVEAKADGLLWNGVALGRKEGNGARFHHCMRERLLASIEMSAQVREEDLAKLLELLAMDAEEVAAVGGAAAFFGETRGSSIRLREVDFTHEVLVTEDVWRKLSSGLAADEANGLRRLIATCARSAGAEETTAAAKSTGSAAQADRGNGSAEEVVAAGIARLAQWAGEATYFTDQAQWQEWRAAMARQFSALNPRWRSIILRAPTGSLSSECPDMLALIAAHMPPADCVSLVLDHPDSIRAERSDMLAIALGRILADPNRRDDIAAALHEQALARGVSEAVYQNVVGLLIARMEGKVGPEPEAPSFQPKVRELGSMPVVGGVTADLSDLLRTTSQHAVRRSRLLMLEESLAARLAISQYGTVVSLLTKAADGCAVHGDADGLISLITALGQQAAEESGQDASRRAVAVGALARCSTDQIVACLDGARTEAPPEARRELIGLLGLLGEPGLRALVHTVSVGEEADVGWAMATLLARDEPDLPHVRDLIAQARGITLEGALRALVEVQGEQPARKLALAISDAGEEAQLQVLALVRQSRLTDLGSLLTPLLADTSRAVRLGAVAAIEELGLREAAPSLCDMAEREANFGEGARLKEAAVRALGTLGVDSSVPVLCRVLKGGAFLSKLGGHRTRLAAAEALALLGGPAAREALARGCHSMHPSVRESCRRALSRLLASEALPAGAIYDR